MKETGRLKREIHGKKLSYFDMQRGKRRSPGFSILPQRERDEWRKRKRRGCDLRSRGRESLGQRKQVCPLSFGDGESGNLTPTAGRQILCENWHSSSRAKEKCIDRALCEIVLIPGIFLIKSVKLKSFKYLR